MTELCIQYWQVYAALCGTTLKCNAPLQFVFLCCDWILMWHGKFMSLISLLLYGSNPSTSLPVVLNILKQFSQLSGCKLNLGESDLLALKNLAEELPQEIAPFRWVDTGFKNFRYFYHKVLNFVPLLKKVEEVLTDGPLYRCLWLFYPHFFTSFYIFRY